MPQSPSPTQMLMQPLEGKLPQPPTPSTQELKELVIEHYGMPSGSMGPPSLRQRPRTLKPQGICPVKPQAAKPRASG